MADHDVPDSTDWLSTPLSGLAAVENSLRCQVCKDFFKTPMISSCSHTFCSLCIRRALSHDGKCPLCRASEQELKLRSNWAMEETVDAFVKTRSALLDLARKPDMTVASSGKRKADGGTAGETDVPEGKRPRTSARLRKTRTDITPVDVSWPEEDEVVEIIEDDEYVPEPEDGLVPCPVCQTRMKEWQVFKHLETCDGTTMQSPRKQHSGGGGSSTFSQPPRQQARPPERLPAINYSMLKDQALRKKMSDLSLSNQGPRALLERRHKEWITIWNANCDAARPKKRSELLHDLEVWERTQGGRTSGRGITSQNAAIIKDKDFDGAAWAAKHDDSFKDLIASARKSSMLAKNKKEEDSSSAAADQSNVPIAKTPETATPKTDHTETANNTLTSPPPQHTLLQPIQPPAPLAEHTDFSAETR